MLGDFHAARRHHDRGRRGHVEGARPIAACSARIEHLSRRRGQSNRVFTHRACEAGDLFRPLTLHDERRKKPGQRPGRGPPLHHFAHGMGGLIGGEVFVANELLDERGEHHRSRKFRRIFRPSPVRTDSGWNWTPWTGYARCRTAMIVPSSCVRAATSRSAGTLSTPITSE